MSLDSEKEVDSSQSKGIKKYFDIHPPVFWPSVILITAMIITTLALGKEAEVIFKNVKTYITNNCGWLFILSVNIFLAFGIIIAFSNLGNIRLGGKEAQPDFRTSAWFAMLFSAGMGIGIMFWSVAEPVYHFLSPPMAESGTVEAARQAMSFTYIHWGFHAWGIYAIVGLALAFFAFNRGLPLSFRSIFQPILGDRIKGWPGDIIDILAVLATLFGLATSLGLGVKQMNAGLNRLFQLPDTVWIQVILIAVITFLATLSVVLGLDKGVRVLSEMNIRIAVVFLLFMLAVGPTIYILDSFIQNIGHYVNHFITYSFWTESYQKTSWQNQWTVFYWAWWISWSPYVGMFIARISKGRTVREFILGVLIAPSLITFLWLTAFGGTAIHLEMGGIGDIGSQVQQDYAKALFVMLEEFPLSFVTSIIAVMLIMSFFVTSSDSGSLVIDSLTSGGKMSSPVGQRIFWAQAEGAVAAVLLIGGGLEALRTASVTVGLPFLIILLCMCYSLYRGLKQEQKQKIKPKGEEDAHHTKKLSQSS